MSEENAVYIPSPGGDEIIELTIPGDGEIIELTLLDFVKFQLDAGEDDSGVVTVLRMLMRGLLLQLQANDQEKLIAQTNAVMQYIETNRAMINDTALLTIADRFIDALHVFNTAKLTPACDESLKRYAVGEIDWCQIPAFDSAINAHEDFHGEKPTLDWAGLYLSGIIYDPELAHMVCMHMYNDRRSLLPGVKLSSFGKEPAIGETSLGLDTIIDQLEKQRGVWGTGGENI